jgi:hypothetical protein
MYRVTRVQEPIEREVWIPVKDLRLWSRGNKYTATIPDKEVMKLLMPFINKVVTLKIDNILIDVLVGKTRNGGREMIEFTLPRRLNKTWEMLRTKGIRHEAYIILRPTGNELYQVV